MHPAIRSIVICLSLLVAAPAGELAPELAPLAQDHKTATEALAGQRAAELARLRKPYLDELGRRIPDDDAGSEDYEEVPASRVCRRDASAP